MAKKCKVPIIPEDATNLLQQWRYHQSSGLNFDLSSQVHNFCLQMDYSLVLIYSHKGYLCLSSCLLLWHQHDRRSFQPCKEKKQEPKLLRQYNKEWVPPELTGISWVGKGFKRECIFMLSWLLRNKQDAEAGTRWTWSERDEWKMDEWKMDEWMKNGWMNRWMDEKWMQNENFGGP